MGDEPARALPYLPTAVIEPHASSRVGVGSPGFEPGASYPNRSLVGYDLPAFRLFNDVRRGVVFPTGRLMMALGGPCRPPGSGLTILAITVPRPPLAPEWQKVPPAPSLVVTPRFCIVVYHMVVPALPIFLLRRAWMLLDSSE